MYRKDQLKGIIALILFAIIGCVYFFSKDDDLILTVCIIALFIWLVAMYFLNKKK